MSDESMRLFKSVLLVLVISVISACGCKKKPFPETKFKVGDTACINSVEVVISYRFRFWKSGAPIVKYSVIYPSGRQIYKINERDNIIKLCNR